MADPIKSSQKTKQTHPLPPLPPLPDYGNSRSSGNSSFSDNPQVYMLQIPKDYVLKVPSDESKQQYRRYTKYRPIQRRIRHGFCRCLCTSICLLVLILITIGCVVYFCFRPKTPTYTLTGFSISGFEPLLNSSVTPLNPSIVATVQTENLNKRISILYQTGGSVWLHFDQVYLCEGDWPSFHQGPKNVTTFATNLTGSRVLLTALNRDKLVKDQINGSIPLEINAKVPVKIKFSFITSWLITARVSCDVMLSSLTGKAAIISKTCRIKTHYLW